MFTTFTYMLARKLAHVFTVERNIMKATFAIYAHFFQNKISIIARKMKRGG